MGFDLGELINKGFGLFLLLVGIVGLLLPIVPGWILIFVGASLLNYKKLNDFLKKLKNTVLKIIFGRNFSRRQMNLKIFKKKLLFV